MTGPESILPICDDAVAQRVIVAYIGEPAAIADRDDDWLARLAISAGIELGLTARKLQQLAGLGLIEDGGGVSEYAVALVSAKAARHLTMP